ncbi:MAG TPA: oligosaccharide flippase family protein [Friedmanniella sp.]
MSSTSPAATTSGSMGRALSLLTATSLLSPVAGLVVAPILAHAFDPTDRGVLAAAIAPSTLILSVATLGLPEALTYFCANVRWRTRALLLRASGLTFLLWLVLLGLTVVFTPQLSKDDAQLARLILLAGVIILPALMVNLLRGAAVGLHAWNVVALERVVLAVARIFVFGGLYLSGHLTLLTAVVAAVGLPAAAGLVYLGVCVFRSEPAPPGEDRVVRTGEFMRYGLRVWLGSIASILLARVDQLLMTPLSSAYDLGIYAVAVTVSELPMVASGAVQSALFGINSRDRDADKLALAGRLFFILASLGCIAVAVTLPLWIGNVFGNDYRAAVGPTILLLAGSLIVIPATSAGTALNAWGRPELRSIGLLITLAVNLVLLFVLVPRYGVYGACYASIVGSLVFAGLLLGFASRVTGLTVRAFVLPRAGDITTLYHLSTKFGRKILRRTAADD